MSTQKSHTSQNATVSPVKQGIRRIAFAAIILLALMCALIAVTNLAAVCYSLPHMYTLNSINDIQNDSLMQRNNAQAAAPSPSPSHGPGAPSPSPSHGPSTPSPSRAILVLGASVHPDKTPSPILRDRLDSAVALYHTQPDATIIVSGDGREAHYNEAAAMRQYLLQHGIPDQRILADERGYTTYASMYHLAHRYHVKQCVVVSQKFHLARAISTGTLLGVSCVGLSADRGAYEKAHLYEMREIPARTKDIFQALARVKK